MAAKDITRIIASARQKCEASGVRFTEKRQRVLELMLESETPLSPYELVERYNVTADANMPANSAYRILDFLAEEDLVHKLNSANKYIACSHIACEHEHDISQFLICHECKRVKEIMVKSRLIKEIQRNIDGAGYKLRSSSLELDCLCQGCAV